MDVDIDRFWSNGCGYVPFSEQCFWKNGYTAVVVRMAGYAAGIGHVYILSPGMRPEGHSAITRGLNPPGGMASRRLASQLSDNQRRCRKQNHGDK